jgi:hypothetical protein
MTSIAGHEVRHAAENVARSGLPDAPVRQDDDRDGGIRRHAASLLRSLAERIEPDRR